MSFFDSKTFRNVFTDLDADTTQSIASAPAAERVRLLTDSSGVPMREVLALIAQHEGLGVLENASVHPEARSMVPVRLVHAFHVLPVVDPKAGNGDAVLATVWPPDADARKWIYACTGKRFDWVLMPPERVVSMITEHFGVGASSLDDTTIEGGMEEEEDDEEDENAAIIRFVNDVIQQAIKDRATDIHFEPRKESLFIRYRIDGQLVGVSVPPNLVNFQSAIISRIKIMSRLNISEKRRPQDGRITFGGGRDEIDVRVSTLPTMYGESVSMRLLSDQSQPVSVEDLGCLPDDQAQINKVLEVPHGIILITGPTGSGKSTTLSAFMRQIATPEKRVITVEDPIEYEIPQVNQTQVNHEIGLTFASALRSVLRQDPDIIMVGEIRDRETADIAVRASLTGHLVLSTLHTNDAPGAVTRLIDMEIEPFLIASSVEMIIAQRLVRRLCPHCCKPADLSEKEVASCLVSLGIDPAEIRFLDQLRAPNGCEACRGMGYRGRIGMFEILRVDENLHELVVKEASAREIRKQAEAHGMRRLQQCGWEHAKRGTTSLSEVMRYAILATEEGSEDGH